MTTFRLTWHKAAAGWFFMTRVLFPSYRLCTFCVSMSKRSILDYIRTENGGKKSTTKIYEVLTSIKWQKVSYIPLFFVPKTGENSYLQFLLCICYFVLPAWITCGWGGREWNRDKKWRINVFAENRLNIAGGIVVFATFYHCHCIVTTLHFKRNSHPHVKMNGFFVFAREHFQFISTIQVTFWLH